MKEFFQRVVDEVATLSTQAAQVEGLRQQVSELTTRVNQVEQANAELRTQLDEARNINNAWQTKFHDVERDFDNERAVTVALRETAVQRDAKVSELVGELRSETDAHRITKANLEDSRRATGEQEARANDYQERLNNTVTLLEEWRAKANDYEKRNGELQAKLDKITSFINPASIHVVSGDEKANVA